MQTQDDIIMFLHGSKQLVSGAGDPESAHLKVTELPTRTIMSVLVGQCGRTKCKHKII